MYARNNSIRVLGAAGSVVATLVLLAAIDGYARQSSEIATSRARIVRLDPVTVIGERPSTDAEATAAAAQGVAARTL